MSDSLAVITKVLYGPTLGSGGAYKALATHVVRERFDFAIVPSGRHLVEHLPEFDGTVLECRGHRNGHKALRTIVRQSNEVHLYVAQNPAIWPTGITKVRSLIQNTRFVRPIVALRFSVGFKATLRVATSWALTELQVFRSAEITTLTPQYPRRWNRTTNVLWVPNCLSGAVLQLARQRPEKLILFVGTSEPFRGAQVALRAFAESQLARDGWNFHMYLGDDLPHRGILKEEADRVDGARLAARDLSPLDTLGRSFIALFPSVLEGSSFAFLEAMHLSRNVIAYDAPHFAAMPAQSPDPAHLHLVATRRTAVWAKTLHEVAARYGLGRNVE